MSDHIVGTYDGSDYVIYINGVNDGSTSSGSFTPNTTNNLYIGSRNNNSTADLRLNGQVSYVAIWDSALAVSEVVTLYNSGKSLDASANSGNYTSSSNLVGYWKLNDGGGTTAIDSSSNSNDGTLTNGPIWSEDVPHNNPVDDNYSVDFDGTNDYIGLSTSVKDLFSGKSSMSIMAKVKIDSFPSVNGVVFQQESTNSGDNLLFAIRSTLNSDIDFYIKDSTGSYKYTNTPAIAGIWYHVVGVFDGATTSITLYINGVQKSQNTSAGAALYTLTEGSENAAIGSIGNGSNRNFNGNISIITVWDSALTQAEITEIYNNGEGINLLEDLGDYASSANVVGYWRLEEGAGIYTKDISGNNNHGTLTNGPVWKQIQTPLFLTQSVDFDGTNDYISVSDSDVFSFGDSSTDSPFSISGWIKMDDATKFRILGKGDASGDYEWLFTTSSDDGLYLLLYDGDTSNRIDAYVTTTVTTLEGDWIYVTATYDGSGLNTGIEIYINGVQQSITRGSTGSYTAMHNYGIGPKIGYGGTVFGGYSNGKVSQIILWNKELTSSEVETLYNQGYPISPMSDIGDYSSSSNVVGYWPLDEGEGTTANDDSTNSNNGTLTNGPIWSSDAP